MAQDPSLGKQKITTGTVLSAAAPIIAGLDDAFLGVGKMLTTIIQAVQSTEQLLSDVKHFKFKPDWKHRVISIPAAEKGINDLWNEITKGLLGKAKEILQTIETFKSLSALPTFDPEAKVAGVFQKLQNLHTFIVLFGDTVAKFVDLTETLDHITKSIEHLDALFLTQQNKQHRVTGPHRTRKVASQ
jgi:hypothetical protein